WLRRLAWERLVKLRRQHLGASKRSVAREQQGSLGLNDESVSQLVSLLAGSATSPSHQLMRAEQQTWVREALAELDEEDREVLVMRYLEGLSCREIAAVLEIGDGAARMR